MVANRRRDTRPELGLRALLHARGLRYRVDYRLPFDRRRRADVVFTRLQLAVFVDGCFWHGCPTHYVPPRANESYWRAKVARNRERDVETTLRLESEGWAVVRVWEHVPPAVAADRVLEVVQTLRTSLGLAPLRAGASDAKARSSPQQESDRVPHGEKSGQGHGRPA